jgi:hypothetical protein
MSAALIAAALGDTRREARAWRCRCPLHGGRSLVLRDGSGGRVLATCWAGCNRLEVIAELRRLGLLDGRAECAPRNIASARLDDREWRTAGALKIWRNAKDGADTLPRRYLASRGLEFHHWPSSLRFHSHCPRPRDDSGNLCEPLPAMVALVEHVDRGPVAVHCTYLRCDGSGKANVDKQKVCFGPAGGGAVRFGAPRAGQWLAIGEGLETTLSVSMACSTPAWAALSACGLKSLMLPPEATHVIICADHDASSAGELAAYDAAARWLTEARRVRIAIPPELGTDFNDVLIETATRIDEARDVA